MKTGKLIIFSAPSGSGKSTIINYLLTQNLNLAFLSLLREQSHLGMVLLTTVMWSSLPLSDLYFLLRSLLTLGKVLSTMAYQ